MSTPTPRPVPITHFPLNRKHLITSGVVATIMILSSSRRFVEPGSPLYDYALANVAPSTVASVQNFLFYFLFGVHGVEVPMFAVLKLRKHGVSVLSGLALKWLVAVFVGGKATWNLFEGAVRAEEKRKL